MTAAEYASLGASAGSVIAATAVSHAPTSTKVETGIGTSLLTAAAVPSPASPFLAIAGGIAELAGALGIGSGCGQTCITASDYANRTSDLAQQNLNVYLALPTPRPKSLQLEAEANFDAIWNALVQQCGNPALGSAGQRCISERQRGGKYDYFSYYRDPIANDTNVYDDTQAAVSATTVVPPSATPTQITTPSGTAVIPISSPSTSTNPLSAISLGGSNLIYWVLGGLAIMYFMIPGRDED